MVLAVVRFGPNELSQVMALTFVSGGKVAAMETINDVINFADSILNVCRSNIMRWFFLSFAVD